VGGKRVWEDERAGAIERGWYGGKALCVMRRRLVCESVEVEQRELWR